MRAHSPIKSHLIILFLLALLGSTVFALTRPATTAADTYSRPAGFQSNEQPGLIPAQQITRTTRWPSYGPVTILLEDQGGSVSELLPTYADGDFAAFYLLKEGDIYYLWLGNVRHSGSAYDSVEQRFESQNGLVWHNRTNTNLALSDPDWRTLGGLRHVIKDGPLYEGWEHYFYNPIPTGGWATNTRYVTSTNGITWTVVNQAPMETAVRPSLIKEGGIYHIWANPDVDSAFDPDKNLRYRTSTSGGSGWGHWKTGGTVINIDGSPWGPSPTRVRQGANGIYQLFYQSASGINLATSANGVTFTTQITDLVKFSDVFSTSVTVSDFLVTDVQGEDWFYLLYGDAQGDHIAVSRPIYPNLVLSKTVTPTIVLPGDFVTYTLTFGNIGNSTARGVVITDSVPSLLANLDVESNVLITDTGYVPRYVWSVPDLLPGAAGIITITGQVAPDLSRAISISNEAVITSTAVETDTTNNLALVDVAVAQRLTNHYLPIILKDRSSSVFPLYIGDAISKRLANYQGEVFYVTTVQVPSPLPSGGHFYLSANPTTLTEVIVDDKIVLLRGGEGIFSYNFSLSGSPHAAIVEIPRPTMEQLVGQTVRIEYRDVYGMRVEASTMWLIWLP